jgi:hypothetical protein
MLNFITERTVSSHPDQQRVDRAYAEILQEVRVAQTGVHS